MDTQQIIVRRRRYRTRLKMFRNLPDCVAGLDVLFLALLFFVLSCSFIRIPGIGVELPKIESPMVADLDRFVVSIAPPAAEGGACLFYFKDKVVKLDELAIEFANIRNKNKGAKIVICADHRVPFDVVTQVMASAQSAELSAFIAAVPTGEKRKVDIEKQ